MSIPLVHTTSIERRASFTDESTPVLGSTGCGKVARFDWISDHQNEIAKAVAQIAFIAIAGIGFGLMLSGLLLAGVFIVVGAFFLTALGVIFNEVVKRIWNKSLMTFD